MKKPLLFPIGILVAAAIFYCLHLSIENFSTQVKFGFLSKILLMIGLISFLLIWLAGSREENKNA